MRYAYVIERLSEPGTLRSLAVVVFALKGIVPDEATLQNLVNLAIFALGLISAFMKEPSTAAAEQTQAVLKQTAQVAQSSAAVADRAADKVETAGEALREGVTELAKTVSPNVKVIRP